MEQTTVLEDSEIRSTDEAHNNEIEEDRREDNEQTTNSQANKPRPIAKVVTGADHNPDGLNFNGWN